MEKKKFKITMLETLIAHRKARRETVVYQKATVTTDKKKKINKNYCRKSLDINI